MGVRTLRKERISRRTFVVSAAAGFFIGATRVYGQDVKRDGQKLRVFKVGTGHMGAGDLDLVTASKKGGPWLLENRRIDK